MASVLAGYPLGQKGAWRWLQENCPPLFVVPLAKSKTPRPRRPKSEPGVPFYQTEAWRWVRYEALKKSDGRCCLCGRPKRDNGVILHVDHIKPRSKFPHLELDVTNLQVLCEDCNLGKSNFDEIDWSAER